METKSVGSKRKTILLSELRRLQFCNSKDLPGLIEFSGMRKQWVGIGWVDDGPATGSETLVLIDVHD